MLPTPDEMFDALSVFDDWEEKYSYVIELGRKLPAMPDALKVDEVLVRGCTARVWLVAETGARGNGDAIFHFTVDSDAAIVKGLCAVLMVMVQDQQLQHYYVRRAPLQDIPQIM